MDWSRLKSIPGRLQRSQPLPAHQEQTSASSPAANYHAYVDALTPGHVAGWARNATDPSEHPEYVVVLSHTDEILAQGRADLFLPGLRDIGVGDGKNGYYAKLPRTLSAAELPYLDVRLVANGASFQRSDWLATNYQPINHIIMDIVDNCNLRCPFCVYDYTGIHTTNLMTEATIDAAVRFAPYVTEGNFWFSCLHEPTLHPRLVDYILRVPADYRDRLFYTTNLAKRMPDGYFRTLAESGMHHLNVSIESLDPAVYERMRKGARFGIFKENWDKLVDAFARSPAPPRLRYISMAYKSNYRELPSLIAHLLNERGATRVDVRHTYTMSHISADFQRSEYLSRDEWYWLRDQLAHYDPETLLLDLPPDLGNLTFDADAAAVADRQPAAEPKATAQPVVEPLFTPLDCSPLPKGFLPGRYGLRLIWDGRLEVSRVWGDQHNPHPGEKRLITTNVRDIGDVPQFLDALPI
jgi:MoaA/NifB/PqqE/SkfB family radical SAM enzyme